MKPGERIRFYRASDGFDARRGAERVGVLTVNPAPRGIEFRDSVDGWRLSFGSVSAAMTAIGRLYR